MDGTGESMNEFEKQMQKEKEDYIAKVNDKLSNVDHIIIYGAGKIGKALYKLCTYFQINISAFCVTDITTNPVEEEGIPVLQYDVMVFDKNRTLILIGIRESGDSVIIPSIIKSGWTNYIDTPKNALYFDYWMQSKITRPVLEITPRIGCSIHCKYCPQDTFVASYYRDNKSRSGYMTFDMFKKCIDKTPQDLIVEFAGFVEPFLNKESIEMMEYTHSTGRDMTLFTTLVGLTKDGFERIKKLPFKEVILHTPDDMNYANIPMTDEYFEILDTILECKKSNGEPFINGANCQSRPHPKVLEHTNSKLKIYGELNDRAGNLSTSEVINTKSLLKRISCGRAVGINHNILLPDGSVLLCCMDFGMQHILGNLIEQSYEAIMKSEELRNIKRNMNFDFEQSLLCRKCSYAVEIET